MFKIGITGGIGSGKSTVCRLLSMAGVPCYDSDSEARRLMNSDPELIAAVEGLFGPRAYGAGGLDRGYIASRVFADGELLGRLDAVVHPAVGRDFLAWAGRQCAPYVVEETALLFESGAWRNVDLSVAVVAPEAQRLRRVCRRDGGDEQAVRARMAHQMGDAERIRLCDEVLLADETLLLIPQVLDLHARILKLCS